MKLIELLVQELPKRGGWPEHATCVAQDGDGLVMFADCHPSVVRQINGRWFMNSRRLNGNGSEGYELAEDYATSVITREQYEASLAAAQQPVWSGEGLPPVGCECEARMRVNTWEIIHVLAVTGEYLVGKIGETETVFCLEQSAFRPIRSEADKKRDEAIECLAYYVGKEDAADLYTAIAAGEVKGVKLDV